jgi:uncharacterized membrane protein
MVTEAPQIPSLEHALTRLMQVGVYGSMGCLLSGLILWTFDHESDLAASLLVIGLIALMTTPALRVLISSIEAVRLRDWLHLGTILAVAVLLGIAVSVASM